MFVPMDLPPRPTVSLVDSQVCSTAEQGGSSQYIRILLSDSMTNSTGQVLCLPTLRNAHPRSDIRAGYSNSTSKTTLLLDKLSRQAGKLLQSYTEEGARAEIQAVLGLLRDIMSYPNIEFPLEEAPHISPTGEGDFGFEWEFDQFSCIAVRNTADSWYLGIEYLDDETSLQEFSNIPPQNVKHHILTYLADA